MKDRETNRRCDLGNGWVSDRSVNRIVKRLTNGVLVVYPAGERFGISLHRTGGITNDSLRPNIWIQDRYDTEQEAMGAAERRAKRLKVK